MALIGFRSPLTYHPWPWSEYTEEQNYFYCTRESGKQKNYVFYCYGYNCNVHFK